MERFILSQIPGGNHIQTTREGFGCWYEIQKRINSSVFREIDRLLGDNQLEEAMEIFELCTKYNPTKIWH